MNYFNSTFEIRADAKRLQSKTVMKRSGKLRPIRKTRRESDARLKQDLTKVLSVYVRLRDPVCVVCEVKFSEHAGHYFHRDMPSVEFDPRNVWGVCADCNFAHETNNAPMREAIFMRLGERAFADLCDLANNHKMKLGRTELEILFSELSSLIEEQSK